MRKKYMALFFGLSVILYTACQPETGELPFPFPKIAKATVAGHPVKVMCYIDTEQYNPLNAMDYVLNDGTESPYFDYVVIGPARIKRGVSGVYIECSLGLRAVLEGRKNLIVPLQQKGIKVLLGLTGGSDDVSFGAMVEDKQGFFDATYDMNYFTASVARLIGFYSLDGVEFRDIEAAKSANPVTFPYPEGDFGGIHVDKFPSDPSKKLSAWARGGDEMNNVIYLLRQHIPNYDDMPIIVREENYGSHLPSPVSIANFTSRDDQLNFMVNPVYASFGGTRIEQDGLGNDVIVEGVSLNAQANSVMYGPLAVNMETITPPIYDAAGRDIETYSRRFMGQRYGLIFYNNLKPRSEESPNLADTRPGAMAGSRLSQADYLSITSNVVLGKDVICRTGGGDYLKTW
jgi:hypothetical protein